MKHQKSGRKFSRIRKQRRALVKSLVESLIIKEKMTTTEAKAKELKGIVDKIINKAKKIDDSSKVAVIRDLSKKISSKSVKKLSGDLIKRFEGRKSGYTRVSKLGRRKGDSAKMAVIEFV
ncbi:MAG: 50S ribosomal protein L17 [Parcubacteria group bacterium]|jgi:large subunit ribosomal protein L17